MQQVVQSIRNGRLSVVSVPDPLVRPRHVLIANQASVVSAGTEKLTMELARKSLLGKARERPDQVRRVLEKLSNEGILNTLSQVREKLDEPTSMGYSSAGVVLACGAGVQGFKPGDRVASNGAHAELVCVPKYLCALVPDAVPNDHAAFGVLGAIALHGVRLSKVSLGETVLVIGLGLIGQITVSLLKAAGVRVLGVDLDADRCRLAVDKMGASFASTGLSPSDVMGFTRGLGVDSVLITASTKSRSPMDFACQAVRAKGRIVLVGVVGLELDRRPFYFKEIEFVVSCSYGPGRYDPRYEESGHDYPQAYVRWTEQRNIQAVLDLMGNGVLDVSPLITHRFPIDKAEGAYKLINAGKDPYLGVLLTYPTVASRRLAPRIDLTPTAVRKGPLRIGCLGSGNFARVVLLPLIKRNPDFRLKMLCSAGGLSATHSGSKHGFESVTADEEEVFGAPGIDVVFVLTRHEHHARQIIRAIESGKSVFVEKPLALTLEEVFQIEDALSTAAPGTVLMVGFNRRFSPAVHQVRDFFSSVNSPLTISFRFNAGQIPPEHWIHDEAVGGGRLIGEACHAIDLATFLTGSLPTRVHAESVGGMSAPEITDDQCFITLRHANGSISCIGYLSGGDKAFPKERLEIFGGGRVAVIDDLRQVIKCAGGKLKRKNYLSQDKGYQAELDVLAKALISGGPPPMTWEEIRSASLASILAVRSIREGIPFEVT